MKKSFSNISLTLVAIFATVSACAPHGERNEYYPNGKLKRVQHWNHGKRHGSFIDYYENGNKSLEVYYVNDKRSGVSIRYSEDGDTISTIQSSNSRQHGTTKAFYDSNKVAAVVEYVDGFEEGGDMSYYVNGQLKHKGQNHLGVKTGIWYYYSEVGDLLKAEHWQKGKLQMVDSTSTDFGDKGLHSMDGGLLSVWTDVQLLSERKSVSEKFKFGSKEEQTELELNTIDGWRQYDAAIGRGNVDNQWAEKYNTSSPYSFVANNPPLNREIDGWWYDEKNEKKTHRYEQKVDKRIGRLERQITKVRN